MHLNTITASFKYNLSFTGNQFKDFKPNVIMFS